MAQINKLQKSELDLIVRSNDQNSEDRFTDAEMTRITRAGIEFYGDLQIAFDHFNAELWDDALPDAIITSTRKKNVHGYFAPDRFERIDGRVIAEIGMNSSLLAVRSDRDSLSTLVHEMCHLWRFYLGPLGRKGKRVCNGYHDLKWAGEMLRVGLVPSDTCAPGGKMTGYRVSHYIEEGGPFDRVCRDLLDTGFKINWSDRIVRSKVPDFDPNDPENKSEANGSDEAPTKKDRIKFSCPGECKLNAWAKPSANLICGTCHLTMMPNDTKGELHV